MKALLTGFEPFGGYGTNPTQMLAEHFNGMNFRSISVVGRVIELKYGTIRHQIRELVDAVQPDCIVMTGQSARNAITPERIAINYAESSTPYNCGTKVDGEILDPEGEDGLFSTLPLKEIVHELRNQGIPSYVSHSAGTFGCNQIFYECQRYLKLKNINIPSGFIHVPLLPEQAKNGKFASMHFDLMIRAFEIVFKILDNVCQSTEMRHG